MRNIFLTILLIILVSCKAQIYPLNTSPGDVPSGAYIKDLTNELNPYVGLWKANWNGKILYIQFKKYKTINNSLSNTFYYYKERIIGERKIIDANGVIEMDRITNFDNDSPEFTGIGLSLAHTDYKSITFFPKNMCNKMVNLDTKFVNPQKTQMQMKFRFEPSLLKEDCQYANLIKSGGSLPINWPKEDIVFTKQ